MFGSVRMGLMGTPMDKTYAPIDPLNSVRQQQPGFSGINSDQSGGQLASGGGMNTNFGSQWNNQQLGNMTRMNYGGYGG